MKLIDADAPLAEYDRLHVGEPGRAQKMIEDAPFIADGSYPSYCPHCGSKMEDKQ